MYSKLFLNFLVGGGGGSLVGGLLSSSSSPAAAWAAMQEPSVQQIRDVQLAFQAFDNKDLKRAESLFDQAVKTWDGLERPRDELAALVKVSKER